MNVKLTIEYDGTDYCGWQIQPGNSSIQGMLEDALAVLLKERVRLHGSGRTDSGVHAAGQVANFACAGGRDLTKLQAGLNALTPRDIVVKEIESVAAGFDARRDAVRRIYEYRLWNRPWESVFRRRYAWHVRRPLEVGRMQAVLPFLNGEHDFSSFRAAGCSARNPVRCVFLNELLEQEGQILYRIEATGYLRHMVRNIVGTLVEVGLGERSVQGFGSLVESCDRRRAGPTAPPQGLCLTAVHYRA